MGSSLTPCLFMPISLRVACYPLSSNFLYEMPYPAEVHAKNDDPLSNLYPEHSWLLCGNASNEAVEIEGDAPSPLGY
jgi:hypothetical protein